MREYLFGKGFEATLPLIEADPAVVRRDRQEMLQTCDGVLVFWGSGSEAWLRMVLRDLRRARGLGRSKPLPFAIYMAEPASPAKADFDTHEGLVIRNASPSELDLLLEPVREGLLR